MRSKDARSRGGYQRQGQDRLLCARAKKESLNVGALVHDIGSMPEKWRDRISTAPLWAIFVGSGAFFGVVIYLTGGEPRWLTGAVLAGFLVGAWMAIFVAVTRRRDQRAAGPHGIPSRVAIARSLRSGELPADQALDQPLLGLIERRRRQLRSARKFNPGFFATLGVFAVVDMVIEHNAASVVYAGLYLGLLVYLRRASVRSAARLDRLESAIRQRSGR